VPPVARRRACPREAARTCPDGRDCRPGLAAELKVTQERGRPLDSELADLVIATITRAPFLRAENRTRCSHELVDDLRVVLRTSRTE